MSNELNEARRRLLGMGSAAVLVSALPPGAVLAQTENGAAPGTDKEPGAAPPISPVTLELADYVVGTLERPLPSAVTATVQLHILDTLAAMVSGSKLKPGSLALKFVDVLGGKPQATVVGAGIATSAVNAAFANGMMAHADETDDTHPFGPFHAGCGMVAAALATGELSGSSGRDMVRAVALGYDVGARFLMALGGTRHNPSCMTNTIASAATSAALMRLNQRQVGHAFSYAGQQASGLGYWDRDLEHVEKAFDFGGMGARNGVTAALLVSIGCTAVDDPFSGTPNILTGLGNKPAPEALVAELGTRFEIMNTTLKKWTVGLPLQSVLDSMSVLLQHKAVRPDNIQNIAIEVSTADIHIIDNNPNPDLCVQHLIALMLVDRGANFASIHDAARMQDPRILALRKRVQVLASSEMQAAQPPHQTIVRIATVHGKTFEHHTKVVRGLAQNPMDEREVAAKALDLMGPVLGPAQANQLIAALSNLDALGSVRDLRPLLRP